MSRNSSLKEQKSAVSTRISELMVPDFKTKKSFADLFGVSPGYVSDILNGNAELKPGALVSFICYFFSVNEEWLLTGQGPKDIDRRIKSEYDSSIPNKQEEDMYISKYIDRLEKDVLRLEEQNKELLALLKEKHLPGKKKTSGRG